MSGDLGNDTADAVVQISERMIESIGKFLEYLLNRNNGTQRLNRERAKQLHLQNKQAELKAEIADHVGEINLEKIRRSGEPYRQITVDLTDKQLADFDRYARQYDFLYASASVVSKSGEEVAKTRVITVLEKDLPLVKEVTDRMNEDAQIAAYDMAINSTLENGELTSEEQAFVDEMTAARERVVADGTQSFNQDNAQIIFSKACGDLSDESVAFDKALNRFTSRDFARDKPYYACERTNPNSYIELHPQKAEYKGKAYTATTYKVYNNGVEQKAASNLNKDGMFTDKRFDGRSPHYWTALKQDMKQKGGFSDDLVVFLNKDDLQRYQQLYSEAQQARTIQEQQEAVDSFEQKDYPGIMEKLKDQLDDLGMTLDGQNNLIYTQTGQQVSLSENAVKVDFIQAKAAAEGHNIAAQIGNYAKLYKGIVDKTIIDAPALARGQQAQPQKADFAEDLQKEAELIHERKQIVGAEVANEVYIQAHGQEIALDGDAIVEIDDEHDQDTRSMDDWKKDVNDTRASQPAPEVDIPAQEQSMDRG